MLTLKKRTYQANMKCAPSGFWGCWACWGTAGTSRATLWLTTPTHCWAEERISAESGSHHPQSAHLSCISPTRRLTYDRSLITINIMSSTKLTQFPPKGCFKSGADSRGNSHCTMTSFNVFQAQKPRNASTQFFRITVTQAWTIPSRRKKWVSFTLRGSSFKTG